MSDQQFVTLFIVLLRRYSSFWWLLGKPFQFSSKV